MDEAEYCHRVALMYRGRVIALGAPDDLKHQLTSHHLLDLESSDVRESMRMLANVEGLGDVAVFGGGLHITVDDADAAMARIRERLGAAGIGIARLERILPSMEDVFVALIEQEERKPA
jgi:ABC-2 type transport system ATP-binding protein